MDRIYVSFLGQFGWGSFMSKYTAKHDDGITILEVLVVLAIIALVAAVAAPRLIGYLGSAKSDTAALQIKNIKSALDLYYIDQGHYPDEVEGLVGLFENAKGLEGWNGPYLSDQSALTDPWGRTYFYQFDSSANAPQVTSLGRDGQLGGEGEDADIGG